MASPKQDGIPRNTIDKQRKEERMRPNMRELHELPSTEIVKFQWEKLSPAGEAPPASEKGLAWAYQDYLFFFGGFRLVHCTVRKFVC